ncbi:MAG: DNA internalization-related competence protein ComEC/Rec2, partial [Candidatus Thiodiazotropha sp.]
LVVLVDPLAPLEAGFWLSFLAVGSIWWIAAGRLESAAGWRQALVIQGAVTLGLVPMLFLLFGQASLIAPLVNLIMVPWFSLVLVPLLLLGLPLLIWPDAATLWFAGLGHLADLSLGLLEGCAALSWAAVSMPQAGLWVWLLALMGVLLGLLPRGVPGRWMGLWMCLPVLVVQPERPVPGGFWLTLLDVGQGLACVVETRNHVLLYDTGPGAANGYSAAAAVIEPYLLSRGRSRIDRLILSNGDQDHAGGATFLKSALAVLSTLSGESARVGDAEACESGLQWDWDGVSFRILHPAPGDRFNDSNNRSCVLQVESGGHRVLLPGDVEKDAEQRLVARYPDSLQSQILIASHHGSAGASSPAWVEAVQPDWVLFSTGYRNSYGFPRASVVDRWRAQGAATLNTADCGSIRFRVEPGTALEPPRRHCVEEKHYWQNCTVSENR